MILENISQNYSDDQHKGDMGTPTISWFQIILYIVIFFGATFANLLVIIAVVKFEFLHKQAYVLASVLAINDLMKLSVVIWHIFRELSIPLNIIT